MSTSARRLGRSLAVLGAALVVAMTPAACSRRPRGLRIVLVVLDTLRLDALDAGPDRPSAMPLLAKRARDGLTFERFYAVTSCTQPSVASLLTGLPPWRHGVTRNGQALSAIHGALAKRMRDAGFHTAAVVASLPLSRHFGFDQGFERFDDRFTVGGEPGTWEGQVNPERHFYRLASEVTDAALAQLDELSGERQFLWVHYFDPHAPYGDSTGGRTLSPPAMLRAAQQRGDVSALVAEARALYDRDVAAVDRELDRLLARLDRERDRFDTHVVVVSDHGESFGEDGSLGHGSRLTPAQLHVPLVVLSPRARAARRSDVAGTVDVHATLLGLAGLESAGGEGRDLLGGTPAPDAILGMRRTYAQPIVDHRLGSHVRLDFDLFYAVGADGWIRTGDGTRLRDDGTDLPRLGAEDEARLLGHFAALSRELARIPLGESPPGPVEEGLHALGYAP